LLPAGAFLRFLAQLLQPGTPLRGPLPVLQFLFPANALPGGTLFLLAGALLRRALLLKAGPFLSGALLLCPFPGGAFPLLLGGALLLGGLLAPGDALLPGGALPLLSRCAFLFLAGPFLGGTLPCLLLGPFAFLPGPLLPGALLFGGAFLLQPNPFLLEPSDFLPGPFLCGGAFAFLPFAFLPFALLPGALFCGGASTLPLFSPCAFLLGAFSLTPADPRRLYDAI
jgi:hypothetical protein